MLIAHGPIAVLASSFFLKKEVSKLKLFEKILFYASAFFLGILPDFDIFYLASRGKPAFLHHSLASHTPAFWISIGLIILLSCYILKLEKKTIRFVLITFFVSIFSHILTDAIAGHIMFFTPFYNHYYTLIGNLVPDNLFGGYMRNPMFAFELVICALFAYQMFKVFFKINLRMLVGFSLIYLLFNTVIYTQIYQIDLYAKKDGNPIIDTDQDGLADTYDYDYDNNFVNNFDQVTKSQLLTEFEKVRSHTSFVPSLYRSRSVNDQLLFLYGKHDLTRGILQAYAQTGNYLPPVVSEYMRKNDITTFSEGVFDFLLSTNRFKEMPQPVPGSLALAKYGKDYALGIVLTDGTTLIENRKGYPIKYTPRQAFRFGIIFQD